MVTARKLNTAYEEGVCPSCGANWAGLEADLNLPPVPRWEYYPPQWSEPQEWQAKKSSKRWVKAEATRQAEKVIFELSRKCNACREHFEKRNR